MTTPCHSLSHTYICLCLCVSPAPTPELDLAQRVALTEAVHAVGYEKALDVATETFPDKLEAARAYLVFLQDHFKHLEPSSPRPSSPRLLSATNKVLDFVEEQQIRSFRVGSLAVRATESPAATRAQELPPLAQESPPLARGEHSTGAVATRAQESPESPPNWMCYATDSPATTHAKESPLLSPEEEASIEMTAKQFGAEAALAFYKVCMAVCV